VTESDRALPFFTIGHSTRQVVELADLLTAAEVGVLVDVRAVPRSRTNPQFNKDVLPAALASAAIDYEHIAALGGLRGRKTGIPPAVNAFWTNQSFHNYADYAMGEEFRAALARLRARGRARRCAIMCGETLWWRCHRRIIADYLVSAGETVFHILGAGDVARARLTPAATPGSEGTLVYPGRAHSSLE
jgi:uncharacterized protein (DUF488 family)